MTEEEIFIHAHNTYIQAMYDFGIPAGLLFSVWIGVTILYGIHVYFRGRDDALCAVAVSLAFASSGVAEWIFFLYNPVTLMFFGAIVPMMLTGEADDTDEP